MEDDVTLDGATADIADTAVSEPVSQTVTEPVTGGNPSWQEILDVLPESLHSTVTPGLQKWDKGVQDRFEKVQSEYSPYKQFAEQKVNPAQIQAALQMLQVVESNPRGFYDKMAEYYGEEWGINGQGQTTDDADEYDFEEGSEPPQELDLAENPLFKQIQEQQNTIASFLARDLESKQQAEINTQIETEFTAIKQKHGELSPEDEKFVISFALQNNVDLPQAADAYFSIKGSATPKPQIPSIVPTSGGIPTSAVDPASMSSKDTRALVQSILANANSNT